MAVLFVEHLATRDWRGGLAPVGDFGRVCGVINKRDCGGDRHKPLAQVEDSVGVGVGRPVKPLMRPWRHARPRPEHEGPRSTV